MSYQKKFYWGGQSYPSFYAMRDAMFKDMGHGTWSCTSSTVGAQKEKVVSRDRHWVIHIPAPGARKREFDVTVKEGVLTVRYTRAEDNEHSFMPDGYKNSWILNKEADEQAVTATLLNGVLMVSVMKPEPPKERKVEVF